MCSTVKWLDPEWPPALKKCLVNLWGLYEEECSVRIKDSCEKAEAYYNLNKEKEGLEEKIRQLQIDLGKAISDRQMSKNMQIHLGVDVQVRDMAENKKNELIDENKTLKLLAENMEKQMDVLNEEKKKLECYIFDLLKAGEENKIKLSKMKAILDE